MSEEFRGLQPVEPDARQAPLEGTRFLEEARQGVILMSNYGNGVGAQGGQWQRLREGETAKKAPQARHGPLFCVSRRLGLAEDRLQKIAKGLAGGLFLGLRAGT